MVATTKGVEEGEETEVNIGEEEQSLDVLAKFDELFWE
jgi:hypothetical protein